MLRVVLCLEGFELFFGQISLHVSTDNIDFTLRNVEKVTKHRSKKAGLSASGFTDNADELSLLDFNVDVLEGENILKVLLLLILLFVVLLFFFLVLVSIFFLFVFFLDFLVFILLIFLLFLLELA